MNRVKSLLLSVLCICAFTTYGQRVFMKTQNGTIIDSAEYANMKAEQIQKMKNIYATKEVKVTIKDNLKEVKRTPDSIIYTYNWDIEIGDPKTKKEKSFEPQDYLGKEFPLPNLKTLNKKTININSLKGKPTLINFWFTTCKPCIEEMPVLNTIKTKLKDSVNFIAITFEPTEKVSTFLKRHKFSYTHIVDAKQFTDSIHMSAFPVNIFLDKKGIVRKIENGIPYIVDDNNKMKMGDGKEFLAALRKLL